MLRKMGVEWWTMMLGVWFVFRKSKRNMEIIKTYIVIYNNNLVKLHETRYGNYYLESDGKLISISLELANVLLYGK